jgi:histidyl-tRNA synthetase
MISLADSLLKAYAIGGYTIVINSLGCAEDKLALNRMLQEKLSSRTAELCEDCQVRFQRNILRILDCKHEQCRAIVNSLDIQDKYLCEACKAHFTYVREGLDLLGVAYEVSPHLVRGLDYYTRTVFEIKHGQLGPQQDALGAGGRYDTLVKQLGGPDTGAIGFAFGVERLLLAAQAADGAEGRQSAGGNLVYLIALGAVARKQGMNILANLRFSGIGADTDYEAKSLKAAMRKANDLNARWVVILGDNELQEKVAAVKDMRNSTQEKVNLAELSGFFKGKMKEAGTV